ncbi:unnamed protein product [Ixodes pacificus]
MRWQEGNIILLRTSLKYLEDEEAFLAVSVKASDNWQQPFEEMAQVPLLSSTYISCAQRDYILVSPQCKVYHRCQSCKDVQPIL